MHSPFTIKELEIDSNCQVTQHFLAIYTFSWKHTHILSLFCIDLAVAVLTYFCVSCCLLFMVSYLSMCSAMLPAGDIVAMNNNKMATIARLHVVCENWKTPQNWAHVVCNSYFCRWFDLQFLMKVLKNSQQLLQAMHFPLASPLTSLFISYHFSNKKLQKQITKKVFGPKTSACWYKTEWEWHHNTSHHSYYIMCHFANYAHHKLHTHWRNVIITRHPALHAHSTALCINGQTIGDMFSNNKSSQHNLHFNIPYKLSTAHILYSICTQDRPHHMLSSN